MSQTAPERSRRTCTWVERRVTALVGGELERSAAVRVRRHLADCPACRREFARWHRAHAALKTIVDESLSDRFDRRYFAALEADAVAAALAAAPPRGRRRPHGVGVALGVLAATALFAVGLRFGLSTPDSTGSLRAPLADPARVGAGERGGAAAAPRPVRFGGLRERERADQAVPYLDHLSADRMRQFIDELERRARERAPNRPDGGPDRRR